MARGKHKAKAANRRNAQAQATIEQLREELAAEQCLIDDVAQARAEARQAQERLREETEGLIEAAQPVLERQRAEVEYLKEVLAVMRGADHEVGKAWEKHFGYCVHLTPGASHVEQVETFFEHLTGTAMVYHGPHGQHGTTTQIMHVQRARGERSTVRTPSSDHGPDDIVLATRFFRPHVHHALASAGLDPQSQLTTLDLENLTEQEEEAMMVALQAAGAICESTPPTLDVDCLPVWGPGPLVQRSGERTRQMARLGVYAPGPTSSRTPTPIPPLPLPSLSARTREAVATVDPATVVTTWRPALRTRHALAEALAGGTSPFMPRPAQARPSQAAALQHIYSQAALGDWVRVEHADWGMALAATGMTAAATYWLPRGQAASFAESEPLDDEAKAELRLPFPQVFLSFAEPLVLEPTDAPTAQIDEAVPCMSLAAWSARVRPDPARTPMRSVLRATRSTTLPGIETIIAQRGASVEGVLLLSDDLGCPADDFAWCLSVASDYGESIGRFVVPARRSLTAHADLIDNLLAVVSWAKWHEPDSATDVPLGMKPEDVDALIRSEEFQADAQRTGAGVRVIDAARTSRAARKTESPGGRQVGSHIRRGHWRKQRHGKGLSEVKMVRISPVLVNAHRGDMSPRVYRIR